MKMNKIAFFTSSFSTNGVTTVVLTLAKEFLDLGYKVDFVVCVNEGVLKEEVPKECNVYELGAVRQRRMIYLLGKYLKEKAPDGMIAASWPNTAVAIMAKLLYKRDLSLIVSEHSHFREEPGLTDKDRLILRYLGKWLYRGANKVVAVSKGVRNGIAEATSFNPEAIEVVYNPLRTMPTSDFSEKDKDIAQWWSKSEKIIAMGRLAKIKDFETLLRAVSIISKYRNVKLLILGEGSERQKLEVLVSELGIASHVRLPGFRKDLYPFYRQADLFVLSSYNEGMANVIIEALSFGVPVVSTDCGGPSEILENGKWGLLAKVGSADDLAEKMIESLTSEHDSTLLMGRSKYFSARVIANNYLNILFD